MLDVSRVTCKIIQAQTTKTGGLATSISGLTLGVDSSIVRVDGPAIWITDTNGSPTLAIESTIVGDVLWQRPKMREQPKSPIGFFRSVHYGESSPKFQMCNEQKANGALTRENQNANNKSVKKV